MYYLILVVIILFLVFVIYRINKDINNQKTINNNLISDNKLLKEIDKYQINYLKNGYKNIEYKGKVLVGDYDIFSVDNTFKVLNKLGYDVDIVKSAEDILYKLKTNDYDYVITNYIYVNGIDGVELCNVIKNELKLSIPIIILSSSSDMKDVFLNYADHYIEKPLTKSKINKIFDSK